MMHLRASEPDKNGDIKIWFDLDARHETYILCDPDISLNGILKAVNIIIDRYKKGLPINFRSRGKTK